jgi:nicotinamidase-related amidase
MRVIYTQSWYQKNDPRYSNHPRANPGGFPGCMAGTWGAEIIDDLKPKGEPCIKKGSYDCFFGTNLENLLLHEMKFGNFGHDSVHRNRSINNCSVVVTGTVANACVDKAVIGFYLRGYDVIVPADCIAAKTKFEISWALRQFKKTYFAKITTSDIIRFEASRARVII